jgi:hypothetical protein
VGHNGIAKRRGLRAKGKGGLEVSLERKVKGPPSGGLFVFGTGGLMQTETARLKYEASAQQVKQAFRDLIELLEKYDPSQPRVPAGNSEGGQWTDGGRGTGSASRDRDDGARPSNINDMLPDVTDPNYSNAIESVPLGASVAVAFVALKAGEAFIAGRIAAGLASAVGASTRISRAVKSIEEYLGGQPDRTFPNKAGDMVLMRGNKKIRFDINNPHPDKEPHFQIEELVQKNGKARWMDAGPEHRYYFRGKDRP